MSSKEVRDKRTSRLVKPRKGHSPGIMGKGAPHKDRTKYTRKDKRNEKLPD